MNSCEYLVSYGRAGEFGRFRPVADAAYRRGDRVVIHSPQGMELGTVLCPVTDGHGRFLGRTALGKLLRPAGEEDERASRRVRERAQELFDDGRRLAAEKGLAVDVIDVEVLLDGRSAIVHHVSKDDNEAKPLAAALARAHDLLVVLQNLAPPAGFKEEEEEEGGCGKPGCGQAGGGGGCTSCGSGGCGTCGKGVSKEKVTGYLAGLREKMESRTRTPLL